MNFKVILLSIVFCLPIAISAHNVKVDETAWEGIASFYHMKFNGRKTANGEIFSNKKLTAANNFLPLGTWVKVTNLENGLEVIVKINDRMSKRNKRLIDLSKASAKELKFVNKGLQKVRIEVLEDYDGEEA